MGKKISILITVLLLNTANIFSNNLTPYQYCLQDLNNYVTIGYKAHISNNGIMETNFNAGFAKTTNGLIDFIISGEGFVRVTKNNKLYYTRKGDFYYDFDENKIVNRDGYELALRNQVNTNQLRENVRADLMVNIQLFKIDIQRCLTIDNIYFEYEAIPEIDYDSRIIFGYLENSNVSAFYSLLLMRYIIYENINHIENSFFLLETINMLICKLNVDEYICRDENWFLIQQWLPYLGIVVKSDSVMSKLGETTEW